MMATADVRAARASRRPKALFALATGLLWPDVVPHRATMQDIRRCQLDCGIARSPVTQDLVATQADKLHADRISR